MSKQDFKNKLAHGTCGCGEPGQEPKDCYNRPVSDCNCCFLCRLACEERERDMKQMLEYMERIAQEEIDAEIVKSLRIPKDNN